MPRADYDLLMSHSKEWLPRPYEAVCAENDPDYPLPFAKIQDADTTLIERMHLKYLGGIYLDVFPLDGVPQGNLQQRIHFARYEFYKRVLYFIYRDPYKHGKASRLVVAVVVQEALYYCRRTEKHPECDDCL